MRSLTSFKEFEIKSLYKVQGGTNTTGTGTGAPGIANTSIILRGRSSVNS